MTDFKYEGKDLEMMSFAPKYHAWVLSYFKKFLGKRVAEIGAGTGSFSELLLTEPLMELTVVEPSKSMYKILQKNTSNDSRVISHNEFFPNISNQYDKYFDSMIYVNVLEHIEYDTKELSYAYNSLREGGSVCIFVPALSWLYSDFDASIDHYRRYHKKDLAKILEGAGFEVAVIRYFDIFGIIPWLIMLKLFRKKLKVSNVITYDKYIVPIFKVIESIIPIPIGKNLIAVGIKNSQIKQNI